MRFNSLAFRKPALLVTPFLMLPLSLSAQQRHAPPAAAEPPTSSLPVTHVSLYKNGVGFFELTGHVTGNAAVTIDFTSSQLNDVLQSITAIDLNGGHISGAGYNSTTPLDQQLKTLPIALDDNPTAADFYAAIRGARVTVVSGGASITGRLLAVESRPTTPKGDNATPVDHNFLTVIADSGPQIGTARTFELTPTTSVRLVDTALHNDVTRYLQLIDANRSQGLRHLTLDDRGTGTRELRVSYISEVPIWKSTYRILFTDTPGASTQTATVQGWSVVDNTTGTDWNNVQLSLIAGAPQSFIQPLSQPIYSRRPEIPIAQEAQLTPQTFDSSIDGNESHPFSNNDAAPSAVRLGAPMSMAKSRSIAGLHGMMAGNGTGIGSSYASGTTVMPPPPPPAYETLAEDSITPTTKTASFDDFFAYNLTDPITIRKNESALVPILQAKLPADRVTLVSFNGSTTSQPLRGLWITNTSGLTLDRGSFSVVESGSFGGEGLLDPVHPGEKRLLSYAADQAIHVAVDSDKSNNHVTLIRGSKGVVNIHHADVHDLTFAIHNAASDRRTVVLELPVSGGYKITSDPQPTETTATVYRFRVEVAPGDTAHLHVGGERSSYNTYYLTRSDDNEFTFLLNETGHNPAFEAALQPVLEARARVADAQIAVDKIRSTLDSLRADEERQRANITALANADKDSRERFVRDLNATEDKITAAQSDLTTRTTALDAAKTNLATAIENFSIDEKP
jgi:hypothetical protein